jgi:hypothetical protein
MDAGCRPICACMARPAKAPIQRFRRGEAKTLTSIAGIPPFQAARELFRRVQSDCAVEIDGNAYSVPWRLIGEKVRVTIMDGTVRIHHGLHEVAIHPICASRRRRVIDPAHFEGLTGFRPSGAGELALSPITPAAHLILVLILFGGGWYGRGRWF